MKLRMYLRGLGIGIVVTALVMMFGLKNENKTLTDAEIRAKAKELGMVDEAVTLKEVKVEAQEKEEPKPTEAPEKEEAKPTEAPKKEEAKPTEAPKKEEAKLAEAPKKEEAKPTEAPKKEETKTEKKTEVSKSAKAYTLTIQGGYSSDRVAKILEEAKVVDNAASFDKFLCSNGYDHKISTGTYNIPEGADYSTIAKMITHSN